MDRSIYRIGERLLRPGLDRDAEFFSAGSPRAVQVRPLDDPAHGLNLRRIRAVRQDCVELALKRRFRVAAFRQDDFAPYQRVATLSIRPPSLHLQPTAP